MSTMDKEKNLQGFLSSGSADEQEEEPGTRVKIVKRTLLSACSKPKKAIRIIISFLIFGSVLFFLGTLVPLNCQQAATDCPSDWIAHQGHCYNFSEKERNWKESQNFCLLHHASLAKVAEEEMVLVRAFTRNHVFWIGLKREPDQPWTWPDGEKAILEVKGNGGDCAYLDNSATASSARCSTEHRYICKKKIQRHP